ncbi:hypothetical protein GALMADRAFT_270615 [Galerina marginata CBS 339.88]|uniref:F-box domain-containing protein n=1 Tax=Galerina marginata (strain CBS 339.88) TaxID=685588 RepID=A0A067SNX7_GALM3|nr:hypothetical protein GALMADRAFT_270615 [Galerina marginata CBS 339.88]
MALTLPYDIWCLIAKFLSKPELLKLYSVNLAFFDLVMNEEYREVKVYHIEDERTRRCLKNMGPVVATRVRSLILRPYFLDDPLNNPKASFGRKMLTYVQQVGKPIESSILVKQISCMTEVTSLTIGCYWWDDIRLFNSKLAASLVTTALSIQRSRLRSLSLSIPLEAYPNIIATTPVLESLEELSITLRVTHFTTVYEEIFSLIIKFIDRHSGTLHTLTVDTPHRRVAPFHFFNNLGQLPKLRKLTVHYPVNHLLPQHPTGIDAFLRNHASQLEEFSFHICDLFANYFLPTPNEVFSHPILLIPMPRLASLELCLFQWAGAVHRNSMADNLLKYLHPMRKTLSRFALHNHALIFPEIKSIVLAIGGPESQLTDLELQVHLSTHDLFDLLSHQLPQLHRLEVGFEVLNKEDDGSIAFHNTQPNAWPDTRGFEFPQAMAGRTYADWKLRHLAIPTYNGCGKWNETKALLAVALPSVITFNGLSPEEFVKISDYTKPY